MECHGIKWDARKKVLSGSVDVVGGEELGLTIACNGWRPKACNGAVIRKRAHRLVDLIFVSEKNKRMRFRLSF